ncbi:MAG: NAD kinase [Flavobacteriaceae bacterium]|nr:NAD kinase [Flavobacteriaceae bacterium]
MKVALYGLYNIEKSKLAVEELFGYFKHYNFTVVVEKIFLKGIKKHTNIADDYLQFTSFKDLDKSYDIMITVGGDGTILKAVTLVKDLNIPILGINTGRLGFLATVQKTKIKEAIEALVQNKFSIKERELLKIHTNPNSNDFKDLNFALNEVAINRKDSTSMININTFIDDAYLNSYWADGLIVATPTGSTGYSLSCGGPVIIPSAKSLVITPIAPHNLNVRPLVIPNDSKIKLQVSGRSNQFLISLDSRIITVEKHTEIYIQTADFKLKMVHFNNQTFLKTLREKMLWGRDTRN